MASSINYSGPFERKHWPAIFKFIAAVMIVRGYVPAVMFFLWWGQVVHGDRNGSCKNALEKGVCLLIPYLPVSFQLQHRLHGHAASPVGYKSQFVFGFECAVQGTLFLSTWFLRDLILYSILSPLFLRFKWVSILLLPLHETLTGGKGREEFPQRHAFDAAGGWSHFSRNGGIPEFFFKAAA